MEPTKTSYLLSDMEEDSKIHKILKIAGSALPLQPTIKLNTLYRANQNKVQLSK